MSRVEPDGEVLPAGPGLPRRLLWLAITALVVVALVGVISKFPPGHGSAGPAAPTPIRTGSSHPPAPQAVDTPAGVATGPPLTLPSNAAALNIVVVGDESWLLQVGRLSTFTTDAYYRSRLVSDFAFGSQGEPPGLLVDSAAHRVWVVTFDAAGSTIHAYDAETLATVATRRQARPIFSAAPLNGSLVYSDGSGVFRFTPGHVPIRVDVAAASGALTADPSRSRVMLLQPGAHPLLEIIGMNGEVRSLRLSPSVVSGGLAVTGSGEVWLGGYGEHGAVLVRLDPVTFATIASSPISFEAGSGLEIIASGTDNLLIETGEAPQELACMDGSDGRSVQTWPIATPVASMTRQTGYVLVGTTVVPLELNGRCTG